MLFYFGDVLNKILRILAELYPGREIIILSPALFLYFYENDLPYEILHTLVIGFSNNHIPHIDIMSCSKRPRI